MVAAQLCGERCRSVRHSVHRSVRHSIHRSATSNRDISPIDVMNLDTDIPVPQRMNPADSDPLTHQSFSRQSQVVTGHFCNVMSFSCDVFLLMKAPVLCSLENLLRS